MRHHSFDVFLCLTQVSSDCERKCPVLASFLALACGRIQASPGFFSMVTCLFFEVIYLRMKEAAAAECIISLMALCFPFSLLIFTVEILDQGSVATPQIKGLSLFFILKQACVYKGYLCTG